MFLEAPNQPIKIISEGSCDTYDWSNGCWKISFVIWGIYHILKYIKIETIILNSSNIHSFYY